jgi:hypothetical protein
MTQERDEKIKDAIIDYIYDYCFVDKVKFLEGDNLKLQVDPDSNFDDDDVIKSLKDSAIRSGSPLSYGFRKRTNEYCKLSDEGVHKRFLDKIEGIGISRNMVQKKDIDRIIQFLCDSSYLRRDAPIAEHLILTKKGINHYESGLSFLNRYQRNSQVRKASRRSIISIIIAVGSLIASILLGILG